MKIRGVDFVMYRVADIEKSKAFYSETLGLKMTVAQGAWAEFDGGNVTIVIGAFNFDPKATGGNAAVGFAVDNLEASLAELKTKNVKFVEDEKWETPVCHGATIEDIDGNKIYLHQRKDGTAA